MLFKTMYITPDEESFISNPGHDWSGLQRRLGGDGVMAGMVVMTTMAKIYDHCLMATCTLKIKF